MKSQFAQMLEAKCGDMLRRLDDIEAKLEYCTSPVEDTQATREAMIHRLATPYDLLNWHVMPLLTLWKLPSASLEPDAFAQSQILVDIVSGTSLYSTAHSSQ